MLRVGRVARRATGLLFDRLPFFRKVKGVRRKSGRGKTDEDSGKKGRRRGIAAALEEEDAENARGSALGWESEVGVRVGVRNRAGEAIGKPVANLRGRWTSANILAEKRLKRPALRFSANRSADRFSSILAADHRERKRKINGKSNYSLGERKSIGKPANAKATRARRKTPRRGRGSRVGNSIPNLVGRSRRRSIRLFVLSARAAA